MRTNNGDYCYDSTGNALVEFFSKAGSLFKNKGTYYGGEASAIDLFKSAWVTDNYKAMQLSMFLRDIRGGNGNRSGFREVIAWIAKNYSNWVEANLHFIPEVGRWDDLESLIDTPCEKSALEFWVRAIQDGHQLAAKWAPREDKNRPVFNKLRKVAGLSPKDFRKLLVKNTNVVETIMCQKEWQNVDYNHVPSVAMGRYNNAFATHDPARFEQWKNALEKGVDEQGNEVKVNAAALFPHDVMRTLYADLSKSQGGYYGFTSSVRGGGTKFADSKLANAQFEALPDYMDGNKMRIMPICDFSGSMTAQISDNSAITMLDVSMGLGLYCSDRVGKDNPFYRKFIPFSTTSRLVDWKNDTFSVAAQKYNDGFCGSTNVKAALDKILEAATMFNATNDQIPNILLVLSDLQFDNSGRSLCSDNETAIEKGLKEWEAAGYSKPKVVFWNLAGYSGSPATVNCEDIGLVSGFSPSVLTAVLGGKDFGAVAIMERAIEKYKIIDPENAESRSKIRHEKKVAKTIINNIESVAVVKKDAKKTKKNKSKK